MAKWVYSFGDGKAEGRADMRNLLGGKGANLAEMSSLGLPVPPGFTITTEVCTWYYANDNTYPRRAEGRGREGAGRGRAGGGSQVRRRRQSAAGLGALRRARLDARHDGHRPQSRPQRPHGAGAGPSRRATSASPGTATAASSRCTPTSCSMSGTTISRRRWSSRRRISASTWTPSSRPTTGAAVVGEYKKIVEKRTGKPFPQEPREQLWGAIGAVFGSWMNQRAITYRRLHADSRELGHRRQRAGHGVRQHGRGLRHRRRLHARSLDRRQSASTASTW